MTEQGASFAKARILSLIDQQGPVRSIDLASAFGYPPRTVTEAIDGLERDGLVRRHPDPDDRRAKRISLTEAGRAAVASSEASRRALVQSMFGALTHDEGEELVRVMGDRPPRAIGRACRGARRLQRMPTAGAIPVRAGHANTDGR